METWNWYAELGLRLAVVALLALGIVKVCEIVDWWATRKTRRLMVQRMVTPDELGVFGDGGEEVWHASKDGEVWQDCPAIDRANLAYHQQRFPDARYRLVRLGEDD